MKLHSNTIKSVTDIRNALQRQKNAGHIPSYVGFKVLATAGSNSHAYAYTVQLTASQPGDGRRVGNSGSYGAMSPEEGYSATYDEWGWMLAELYDVDPQMLVGSKNSPIYDGVAMFIDRTAMTYYPRVLLGHLHDGYDPYPYVVGKGAKTKRGYVIGRRGAGRLSEQKYGWGVYMPRTIEEVQETLPKDGGN